MGIRFANAPVSWGVDIVDWGARPPYAKFLDELKTADYEGTELGPYGYLPTDVSELKDQLRKRLLTLTSAFVGLRLKDPAADLDEVTKVTTRIFPTNQSLKAFLSGVKACVPAPLRPLASKLVIRDVPALERADREFLVNYFLDRNKKLGELIGRSLDEWNR